MALTFPLTTLLTAVKGFTSQTFLLKSRQEQSTQSVGVVRGKDFGSAVWFAAYTTVEIPNDDAVAYEALLNSLDGLIQTFELYDLRRPAPRLYPSGSTSSGTLTSVNTNNKAMTIGGLTSGQVISAGDYISLDYAGSRALHQAMETVTAGTEFEVRPHIRPGFTVSQAVNVGAARGLFTLMPGSVTSTPAGGLHSIVSFQAGQYLS